MTSQTMATTTQLREALHLLLQSHEYVRELDCEPWDFAVALGALEGAGLTHNDIRWLLAKDYVRHALEVKPEAGARRTFRPKSDWVLGERTCFTLTSAGVLLARNLAVDALAGPIETAGQAEVTPRWDAARRILCLSRRIIKHFKVPAPNQELILAVFEEEAWPYRIDDPLPSAQLIEPKRRLHDTINSLNRNQRECAVRFFGDGQGCGVCWELVA